MNPRDETFDYRDSGGRFAGLIAFAIFSFAALGIGAFFDPAQFAFSYLFAFAFYFTICAGALFWVLVHHAVGAEWSVTVRRQLENLAALFPALALLFLPLVFAAPKLWAWMGIPPGQDALLDAKSPYLTPAFFWLRASLYFAFFVGAGVLLRAFSVAQDRDGEGRHSIYCRKAAFAFAPLFALCVTFASIDWLMGLDYRWFSALWGVYIFAGSALASICALVLVITAIREAGYLRGIVSAEHYHAMGKLVFAFTIFWAYIAFSQYLLIWFSNIPEETAYFLRRSAGSWWFLQILLVAGHFVVPFLLLLSRGGKRRPGFLCGVAIWILIMHALDLYLVVLPALHGDGARPSYMDLFALLAIGCALAAVFLKQLGESALFPAKDPRLQQSVEFEN